MHQRAVVVVRPLLSKTLCWHCKTPTDLPFCQTCQRLQDYTSSLTHFEILGITASLKVDLDTLKDHFYNLSRELHPDRFVSKPAPEGQYALRWTTAVNRAYQTLRDPEARSYYLVELLGQEKTLTQVPVELAETYFEIQDLLEHPEGLSRLQEFSLQLEKQLDEVMTEWDGLANSFERETDKKSLALRLQSNLSKARYLKSMMADLIKKEGCERDSRN